MADMASPKPRIVAVLLLSSGAIPWEGTLGSMTSTGSRVAAYASAAGREGKMAQEVGAAPSARGGRTA